MASKLNLRTERLAELTSDDLHSVTGGAQALTIKDYCYSLIRACPSFQQACTTAMSCGCSPTWNCA